MEAPGVLILLIFMIPEFLETKKVHAVNGLSEGAAITSRYILSERNNLYGNLYGMAYCEVLGIITIFKLFYSTEYLVCLKTGRCLDAFKPIT